MMEVEVTQLEPLRGKIGPEETVGDLEICVRCDNLFNSAYGGYHITMEDVEGRGANHELFKEAAEDMRNREWLGFEEEDLGPWCDSCSWNLQNKRTGDRK